MAYSIEKCIECGKDFLKKNAKQIRCRECQKKADLVKIKAYNKRKREQQEASAKDSAEAPATCCRYTTSCLYGSRGSIKFCNYFNVTGALRGREHPVKNGRCDLYRKGEREKVTGKNTQLNFGY